MRLCGLVSGGVELSKGGGAVEGLWVVEFGGSGLGRDGVNMGKRWG